MEKFFSINKWFVFFCGVFVLVWLSLQTVVNQRIMEIAKIEAVNVFSWQWQDRNWGEKAEISEVKVLKLTRADAEVKIKGKQQGLAGGSLEDLSATLTFYRQDKNWILARVEFD